MNIELHQYIVTFKEYDGDKITIVFKCAAEDAEHACEQCKNAFPWAKLLNVTRFDMEDEE